ncbi:hypothetical protein KQI68_08510 [Peptoniphilus sp. MSJ-1]|uniref:Uncharacterized protein n=1 Tax=Peptoniphilus ovalis TaxID=2841503 RepID=A0ABS6FI73_9FIRM|nr:hypothetical protein [Peptoniphilus ovalis]MBU5669875.1 hypothetical protein [Peptoniphilus ovalis]
MQDKIIGYIIGFAIVVIIASIYHYFKYGNLKKLDYKSYAVMLIVSIVFTIIFKR